MAASFGWGTLAASSLVIGLTIYEGGAAARHLRQRHVDSETTQAGRVLLLSDFLTVLPLAFVMIAGPQIISAVFLATSVEWARNSVAYVVGAAVSITLVVTRRQNRAPRLSAGRLSCLNKVRVTA